MGIINNKTGHLTLRANTRPPEATYPKSKPFAPDEESSECSALKKHKKTDRHVCFQYVLSTLCDSDNVLNDRNIKQRVSCLDDR